MDNQTRKKSLALERIIFFSDAVMAIAITLLAIDLRLPDVAAVDDQAFWNLLGDLLSAATAVYAFGLALLGLPPRPSGSMPSAAAWLGATSRPNPQTEPWRRWKA